MASPTADGAVTLFLCGDVMLGRGLDQVLPSPGNPELHERYVLSADTYVEIAERAHGPIPAPIDFAYPWGDALAELERAAPHARIVNLETAITTCGTWEPKGTTTACIPATWRASGPRGWTAAFSPTTTSSTGARRGSRKTLEVLRASDIRYAGAGRGEAEARRPAVMEALDGRVLVFTFAVEDSGVPPTWSATKHRPGVCFLPSLSRAEADRVIADVGELRRDNDVVIASIHWGPNWGYAIPHGHRRFAHRFAESGVVDVIHGHSSHHAKAVEIHAGKPILYGCGDFLNDYEGIEGYEPYRDDLALMYFVAVASGDLIELRMIPLCIRRFRLERAPEPDVDWLQETLDQESAGRGTRIVVSHGGALEAHRKRTPASAPSAGPSRR
jgi:poly-gamma-glutamate synthesis protein (capsule biosynthesis protein)